MWELLYLIEGGTKSRGKRETERERKRGGIGERGGGDSRHSAIIDGGAQFSDLPRSVA